MLALVSKTKARPGSQVPTYRADHEYEKNSKDVDRHIVRALLPCRAAGWFCCILIILPSPQLGLEDLDGNALDVWNRHQLGYPRTTKHCSHYLRWYWLPPSKARRVGNLVANFLL